MLGVAGLISKGAFQCPQLYFENRIENAIKVKMHFENLVSKQDSKRDQKRPRNGLETFTVIIPIVHRIVVSDVVEDKTSAGLVSESCVGMFNLVRKS